MRKFRIKNKVVYLVPDNNGCWLCWVEINGKLATFKRCHDEQQAATAYNLGVAA